MSSSHEVGEIFGEGNGPASALLRSPTVIIAAIGLWGMNVYLFRLFGIDYVHVLTLDLIKEKENASGGGGGGEKKGSSKDNNGSSSSSSSSSSSVLSMSPSPGSASKNHPHHHLGASSAIGNSSNNNINGHGGGNAGDHGEVTWGKLVVLSLSLLILLHLTAILWIDVIGGSTIGAIFAFYTSVVVGIALPLPSTAWIRTACATVFHRTFELLHPRCYCLQAGIPRAVPFIDVFFADILCSLSKVFFDWGMLWHVSFLLDISHSHTPMTGVTHASCCLDFFFRLS